MIISARLMQKRLKTKLVHRPRLIEKIFCAASQFLEEESSSGLKFHFLNDAGSASYAVGSFIGGIPKIKGGAIDGRLQEEGKKLKESASNSVQSLLASFAKISDPGVEMFTEKMQDLILIYNHTDEIYFDDKTYICVLIHTLKNKRLDL